MKMINFFTRFFLFFFLFSLLLEITSLASVQIDYPGYFSEDVNLPGIPSKNIDEYKSELLIWSKKYNIILDQTIINAYIQKSIDMGFESNVNIQIEDEDYTLFDKNILVMDLMRDLIFLETMQKSITHWNSNYIYSNKNFSEAYNRAINIWDVYKEYMNLGNFNKDHINPIVNALFGSGGNTYGNIFLSDGTIEKIYEDRIISLAESSVNAAFGNENFIDSIYNGAVNITTLADITTNFIVNIIKQYDGEIGQLGDTLSTAAFGIAGGGFGMVLAPAQIFASTVDYIATSFKNVSKGAHLINYYYFTKYYPDFTKQYLLNSDPTSLYYGVIDNFIRLQELRNFEDLSQDQIALDLTSGYYHLSNSATIEEAKAAYAIAGLLITIEKLDIEKLKRNLVARIKIEDIKEHGFLMNTSYSSETDQYEITLPEKIVYNENHGGYPKSISYELNNQEIFSVFPNSVLSKQYVEGTDLVKNLSLTLSQYENTKKDSTLSVTIIFHDNFQMNSSHKLIFYPQITNFELQKTTSGKIFDDQDNKIYISYCGDNISYLDLFYKNQDDDQFNIIEHELNTNSITSNNENCTTHYLIINTSKLRYNAGYGDISFYAKAASKKTNIINLLFVDPNDIDNDKLPDSWEEQYFGNLIQSTYDDYDNDNKTNYQEYVIETDPTKVGLEEIIKTITLKPYQDINGNWVNTYYLSGEINAHVILENGTINLDGKALHINGNIYLKGGVLFINKGKLTITGSLITSGSSKLRMITAEDLIIIEKDMEIGGSSTIKGSEYNGGSIVESYLTNGIIKLKGNLKQIGTGHGYGNSNVNTTSKTYFWMNSNNKYSFYSSGKHTVIFNGTAKQSISFSSTSSKFSNVILENDSNEGIEFLTSFRFNSLDQNNSKINGDINLTNGITLSHDLTINGSITISSGTLDLTNCKLSVAKNFTATGNSILNINKGNLNIQGNIYMQGSSKLKMINAEALIVIDGDMEIGGSSTIKGSEYNGGSIVESYLTNGIIKLKGNFKQIGTGHGYGNSNVNTTSKSYYWMNSNNKYSFYSSGKHTVIFNGTAKQRISFSSTSSKFSNVILENGSNEGIEFLTSFRFNSLDQKNSKINGDINLTNGITLSHDLTINGSITITSGILDLTNCKLSVAKNFTATGNSILNINKGNLNIQGNIYMQGSSKLKMINAEALIVIDGDMEIGGSSTIKGSEYNGGSIVESYLTNGIIKLKGNFKQIGTGHGYGNSNVNTTSKTYYWMNSNNKYSFYSSGNHTVIFNGTAKQNISFSSTSSKFSKIILDNNSKEGIEFLTSFKFNSLDQRKSIINGDINLTNGITLSHDLSINGNFTISSGILDLTNCKILIYKDFTAKGDSVLNINKGNMVVQGNIFIQESSKLKMIHSEDLIIIDGNMEIGGSSSIKGNEYNGGSIVDSYLTDGTIKLKGNFKQIGTGHGYGNSNVNTTNQTYYWMNPNNKYSFYSSGKHTVIFNGTKKQVISFSSTSSKFCKVLLENDSNEGVNFLTSFRFSTLDQNDTRIIGDMNLTNPATLSHDLIIDGNFSISSGVLDLTNCNLLITKDFTAKGDSILNVNKGQMIVNGNLYFQGASKLKMIHSEDLIVVDEDLEIGGSSSIKGNKYNGGLIAESYLTDGIIKLKGNFKQIGTGLGYGNSKVNSTDKAYYWMNSNNKYSFYTSGNHTVIFNGTAKQSISYSSTNSMFNNLILKNTSENGVEFKTTIYAVGTIQSNESNIVNAKNLNLQKVGRLNGNWNNNLTLNNGWLLSDNQEINGNLYLTGGTLEPNNNTLTIIGNLITLGTSKLKMTNPEDQIIIEGNFEIGGSSLIKGKEYNGGSIVESYLTCGTIKLKGNFAQIGNGQGYGNSNANSTSKTYYWMNPNNMYSFYSSGDHTIIFNGTSKQDVSFSSTGSKFSKVILENSSNEGVEFLTSFRFNSLKQNNSKIIGDINLTNGMTLSHNLSMDGNLSISSGTLDLNNCNLLISKNFIAKGNTVLNINKGNMFVQRNISLVDTAKLKMIHSEDLIVIGEDMEIGGSSSIKGNAYNGGSIVESYLVDGTIKLKGNFKQIGTGHGYGNSNANSSSKAYYWMNPNNKYSFYTSGNHTVILNGTTKQSISFSSTSSMFNNLILENTSEEGVDFETKIYAVGKIKSNDSNILNAKNLNLQKVGSLNGIWNNDLTLNKGWQLSGDQEINGNLYLTGGTLEPTKNTLIINGSLITSGSSKLKMINPEDQIVVGGNFEIGGSSTIKGNAYNGGSIVESYLTDGTIKVKGDFKQVGTGLGYGNSTANSTSRSHYWMNSNNKYSFYTSGNHIVILNGNAKQSVLFQSANSKFNILVSENRSNEGIDFLSKIVVSKLFNHNRNTFKIYEMSSFNDYDSDNINDNIDYYPLNPNKWKEYLPDIDQNGTVNITDVILALKIISSNHFDSSYIKGLDEIVCILQILVNIESEFCN